MKPREIYRQLCEAPDPEAAVRALSCEELTAVAGYLATLKCRGIAAQIWGIVQEALEQEAGK
jgi:hypothetical protein